MHDIDVKRAESGLATLRFGFSDVEICSTRLGGDWKPHTDATRCTIITKPYYAHAIHSVMSTVHAHTYAYDPNLLYTSLDYAC